MNVHRIRTRVRAVALLALAAGGPPRAMAAQRVTPESPVQYGAIDGTVVDTTGASIPLVEVIALDEPHLRSRSGSGGGYRIDSVPAGVHVLRYRRVGLAPLTVTVNVRANDVTDVDAILAPLPKRLATVTVQDSAGNVLHLPADVAGRMRNNAGYFITAADIERLRPINVTALFRNVPGVELTKSGTVNNNRGIISIQTPGCRYGIPTYIDGQKLADPHDGADTLSGRELADYVQPSEVMAVEVYRGPSEVPPTLPQDKCGGVFIWTKRGQP